MLTSIGKLSRPSCSSHINTVTSDMLRDVSRCVCFLASMLFVRLSMILCHICFYSPGASICVAGLHNGPQFKYSFLLRDNTLISSLIYR